jgi:hypothetical protein
MGYFVPLAVKWRAERASLEPADRPRVVADLVVSDRRVHPKAAPGEAVLPLSVIQGTRVSEGLQLVLVGVDGAEDAGSVKIHAPVTVNLISRDQDRVRVLRRDLIENHAECGAVVGVGGVRVAGIPAEIPGTIDPSHVAHICVNKIGYRNQGDQRLSCQGRLLCVCGGEAERS